MSSNTAAGVVFFQSRSASCLFKKLCGTQAPEPIHMVLSPPSSRAAEAAPEDPVAAAGSGAGGPAEGAEEAAPGIPGPEAGSFAGAAGGRRVVRCRRRLCVRPGSPRGAG